MKKIWDSSRHLAATSDVDENKAWERFQKQIKNPSQIIPLKKVQTPWLRIAAAVFIIAAISWAIFFISTKPVKQILATADESVLTDTLPDGSFVTINKHSSLSYPSRFKDDTRSVELKGEAFFNVVPDKRKPFVIDVNDIKITVVGTSFNVKSYNGTTEVIVETGVVRVTKGGKTVELKPNERLVTKQQDSLFAKEIAEDKLYNYYRTKEFVCDETPLWKLINVVNEAYGTNIIIGDASLRNLRLTTKFNNESLEQVLNIISLTFDIKVVKEENKIILTK